MDRRRRTSVRKGDFGLARLLRRLSSSCTPLTCGRSALPYRAALLTGLQGLPVGGGAQNGHLVLKIENQVHNFAFPGLDGAGGLGV